MVSKPKHKPAGRPDGGQFAPTDRPPADEKVQLVDPADPDTSTSREADHEADIDRRRTGRDGAQARYLESERALDDHARSLIAARIQHDHPDVSTVHLEWDENGGTVTPVTVVHRNGDGTETVTEPPPGLRNAFSIESPNTPRLNRQCATRGSAAFHVDVEARVHADTNREWNAARNIETAIEYHRGGYTPYVDDYTDANQVASDRFFRREAAVAFFRDMNVWADKYGLDVDDILTEARTPPGDTVDAD